jgi:hypothetical protein
MNESRMTFLDGVFWYLETRNWAFQKIRLCPRGSQGLDIKMYHYLYFSNLFGAIDIVGDYRRSIGETADFDEEVRSRFANHNDYQYARELRNSIVHRGLDSAAAGHADDTLLYVLCPPSVRNRGGNAFSCSFQYTVQLAEQCNSAANAAIFKFLHDQGFFDPVANTVNKAETLDAIKDSSAMPDWAKRMALQALDKLNFEQMATTIAATRVANIKQLLDPC